MARPKKFVMPEVARKFYHEDEFVTDDGFSIFVGEYIKIKGKNTFGVGEWGLTFKVKSFVTNLETGQKWVDCYEMYRGRAGVMRSFPLERIKRIPVRRKRVARKSNG